MLKDYFKELAEYHLWANTTVCNWLDQITDHQWKQEVVSSFNSIQQTVLHVMSADKAWLERFRKNPNVPWLQNEFKGTKEEHLALLKKISEELKEFIDAFDENDLEKNLDFKRLNGDAYSMPYYQLFAHIANHGTYHRGQLVTMLRQVGFTNVSATDLLAIYRNRYVVLSG